MISKIFRRKTIQSVQEVVSNKGLTKTLGVVDLIFLGLGGIIGSGVFVLTGAVAAKYSGPAISLSYIIGGISCIFVALVYTELATMIPTSGSVYSYSYIVFGEMIAWIVGGIIIIEMGISSASVASGWSAYVQSMLSIANISIPSYLTTIPSQGGIINLPASLIVLLVGGILFFGTKDSKMINSVLVILKISAILIFCFFALPHFDVNNFKNFIPFGFSKVYTGASILFFAFTGFSALAATVEECKRPKRDIAIGMSFSLIIVIIMYCCIALLLTGMLPFPELNKANVLAYALESKGHTIASFFIAFGIVTGLTTVIMINIYAQSRIFYVIARDGLLPNFMMKLHKKYNSPYISIVIFTILIAIVAGLAPYDILGELASMAALLDYIIVIAAVIILRFSAKNIQRPFKCPMLFIIAPLSFGSCAFLLSKQMVNFESSSFLTLTNTGKFIIFWLLSVAFLYFIRIIFFPYKINKAQ